VGFRPDAGQVSSQQTRHLTKEKERTKEKEKNLSRENNLESGISLSQTFEQRETDDLSNPEQAGTDPVPVAASPGFNSHGNEETGAPPPYPRWYFTRPLLPLNKAQARAIRNRITLGLLPMPPADSWVLRDLRRWS